MTEETTTTTTKVDDESNESSLLSASPSQQKQQYCITFEDVKAAAERIKGIAHLTPVLTCKSLIKNNNGKNYFFKVEAMQRTGSFKFRGALNATKAELEKAMSHKDSSSSSSSSMHVVTHSSGNHAQALALAAKLASNENFSVSATIVMPQNAPDVKKNAVIDFGAKIVMVENTNEARKAQADKIVETTGAIFIHPSEDPRVIAGQGTTCLEFVEQMKQIIMHNEELSLDAVVIPVGGGGLAAGNTVALRGLLGDKVKIILAEPSKLDDAKRSFTEGKLLKHEPDNNLDSVADGLKTTLGPNTWPIIRDNVDDIFTVSEEQILRATKLVWERLKVCIEPSAGVGVAVAMGDEFNEKYSEKNGIRNVGIILCGGNVDITKIAILMNEMGI